MKMRHPISLLVAVAICLLTVGGAWAQAADEASEADPSELTGDENLSLIDEDVASLSNKQKLNRAEKKITRMRENLESTTELLQSVRDSERDVLKINCINEKLAAIKGFVKVSEQSYINLEGAVRKGDGGSAEHHYKLISVAHQKVRNLGAEANLCTGNERRFSGKRDIEVEQPTNGVEESDGPDGEDILYEELPELTPYQ